MDNDLISMITDLDRAQGGDLSLTFCLLSRGLFGFGFGASSYTTAPDLEHLGSTDRACSRCSWTTVFHGNLFFSLHFPLFLALDTIC
jgi:hypothetical protein